MTQAELHHASRLHRALNFVRGEAIILSAIAIFSGLVIGFLHLAGEVGEGETAKFDNTILSWMRTPGNPGDLIGPPWFEEMMRDITSLGSYALLTLLVGGVVIYLLLSRMKGAALLVLVSVVGGSILSTALKLFFDRPRPDLEHFTREFTSSFPSGHSMLSAVTYLTLGALLARIAPSRSLKIFAMSSAIFLTVLVGLSRIYLGAHFPTDVLAGWCLGSAWALLCSAIAVRLQNTGAVETKD